MKTPFCPACGLFDVPALRDGERPLITAFIPVVFPCPVPVHGKQPGKAGIFGSGTFLFIRLWLTVDAQERLSPASPIQSIPWDAEIKEGGRTTMELMTTTVETTEPVRVKYDAGELVRVVLPWQAKNIKRAVPMHHGGKDRER